jgi:hypothetical protein
MPQERDPEVMKLVPLHVVVPELVLDGVGMVRPHPFKKLFDVVCGWPCLTLAASCNHRACSTLELPTCLLMPLFLSVTVSW